MTTPAETSRKRHHRPRALALNSFRSSPEPMSSERQSSDTLFRRQTHRVLVLLPRGPRSERPPTMSDDRDPRSVPLTRRRVLAAGGTAVLASLAGCTTVVDTIADQALEDVNVLNQLNRAVSGSVTVTTSAGDPVLDETFAVPSKDADGESNVLAYDDVWRDADAYRIGVELTDVVLEGVSQATETVRIEDTEEEMVAVAVGSGEADEPIAIRVGESLSDFGRTSESE